MCEEDSSTRDACRTGNSQSVNYVRRLHIRLYRHGSTSPDIHCCMDSKFPQAAFSGERLSICADSCLTLSWRVTDTGNLEFYSSSQHLMLLHRRALLSSDKCKLYTMSRIHEWLANTEFNYDVCAMKSIAVGGGRVFIQYIELIYIYFAWMHRHNLGEWKMCRKAHGHDWRIFNY